MKKPTVINHDFRKKVEGACICLKAFRGWDEQQDCEYAEKHNLRDCCKHYTYDGCCKLPDEAA